MTATVSQRLVILFAFAVAPVGVLAPKGIVPISVMAGLAGIAYWVQKGFPRVPVTGSFAGCLAALGVWAAASAFWSFQPANGVLLVLRLAGVGAAGAGLLFAVSRLDDRHGRWAENALLAGFALGLAILAAGFVYAEATGDSLWGTYYFDPLTTLNTGTVAISLLGWPAFAVLWRRGRKRTAVGGALSIFFGFVFLSSGAALLAPVAGLAMFSVVFFLGRRGALALAAVFAVLVLASPRVVSSISSVTEAHEAGLNLPPSARHRLAMWAFATELIDQKPIWGWGMDASRSIPQEGRRLAANMELMPLHPHNAFLQVRLELGLPGAVIAAALLGLLFAEVVGGRNETGAAAFMAGAGGAYLTVAAISYGVWQNWWVAFAWALAALMMLAVKPRRTSAGEDEDPPPGGS